VIYLSIYRDLSIAVHLANEVYEQQVKLSSQAPSSAVELLPVASFFGFPQWLDISALKSLKQSLSASAASSSTRQSYSSIPVRVLVATMLTSID